MRRPVLRMDFNPQPVSSKQALAAGVPKENLTVLDEALTFRFVRDNRNSSADALHDALLRAATKTENSVSDQIRRSDAWVETELPRGWTAAYRLAVQDGIPVIGELRVFPKETWPGREKRPPGRWTGEWLGTQASVPLGGLGAATLRSVTLTPHLAHAERLVAYLQRQYPKLAGLAFGLRREVEGPVAPRRGGPGRPRHSDRELARLAKAYVDVMEKRRDPIRSLARRHKLNRQTIRGRIHEARRRGLLPKAKQGAPFGRLTAKARALLRRG
jgi:hypothetical protein